MGNWVYPSIYECVAMVMSALALVFALCGFLLGGHRNHDGY